MGINIESDVETPPADVGGDRNPNNNDTYEDLDDNADTVVQV